MKTETVILIVMVALVAIGGFFLYSSEKSQVAASQQQVASLQSEVNTLQTNLNSQKQQQQQSSGSGGGIISGVLSLFGL